MHECFIIRAEFFRRALNGNWAESDDRIIKLREDDPEIFAKYLHVVYTNKFPAILNTNSISKQIFNEYMIMAQIYVLAEKLQDASTKNAVVKSMMKTSQKKNEDGHKEMPGPDVISIIYNGTLRGSAGRRLLADLLTDVDDEGLRRNIDKLPKDFLGDLAVTLCQNRPAGKSKAMKNGVGLYLEKRKG